MNNLSRFVNKFLKATQLADSTKKPVPQGFPAHASPFFPLPSPLTELRRNGILVPSQTFRKRFLK
jgi:hypothetical protein